MEVGSSFMFFNADDDAEFRSQGPPLLHFYSIPLSDLQPARRKDWKNIVLEKILLPATSIRIFDGMETSAALGNFKTLSDQMINSHKAVTILA